MILNYSFLEFALTILPGPGNYPHRSPICKHDLSQTIMAFREPFYTLARSYVVTIAQILLTIKLLDLGLGRVSDDANDLILLAKG